MEASGSHLGYKAILMSDIYYQSGPSCQMSFWYDMYGKNVGALKVIVKTSSGQNLILKTLTGDQGPAWRQMNVSLPSYHQFSILFEAVQGNGYLGDVAIDDIKFSNCAPSKRI